MSKDAQGNQGDKQRKALTSDPSFVRGMTNARMSRRDVLRAAGAGAGALALSQFLAACSGGGGGGGGGSASINWNAKPNKKLNFANWPLYIDKEVKNGRTTFPSLEKFTAATGIEVNYQQVIQQNASFFGKIQPDLAADNYCGYDIIVITNGETLTRLVALDYLVELPKNKRPNFDQYASDAVTNPSYDPGNKFTMAWQSGLTGIGWDPKLVRQLRPGKPEITSLQDLFDPAFTGKVGMFADNQDLPNLAMLSLDIDPETSTPDDWERTARKLTKQRDDGIVRQYYEQNYIQALSNGDVALTMAWSGDIYQTNTSGDSQGLQFTVPEEGAIIWTDNMCIPVGVKNPVDAIKMMDFVYDPQIQALIEDWNTYICPVPAAREVILNQLDDPDVANSPLVFPSEEELSRTSNYRVLTADEQTQWNSIFQPVYQS